MTVKRFHELLFTALLLVSAVVSFPLVTFCRYPPSSSTTASTSSSTIATTTTTASSSSLHAALFTQVISDVDDTLKSSGGLNVAGVALGGIDVQYERGQFYPGVAEFMFEMSRHGLDTIAGSSSSGNSGGGGDPHNGMAVVPPKLAILTARAEELKGALEIRESSKLAVALRRAAEQQGVEGWGIGPVLYGSVAEWIVQDRKGLRKFTNFERLLQQDPTGTIMQYVYVGDVGELDQEAGETMLREYPEVVKGVFLHVVTDVLRGDPLIPALKFINGRPLVFFRTYVGAAVDAVQLGFLKVKGLKVIMEAAVQQLANVPETSDKWRDLQRDLARAEVLLARKLR